MAYVKQHPEFTMFRVKKGVMPDFSGANMANQEVPQGIKNGQNRIFTLAHPPIKESEYVYKDGMRMQRASSISVHDGDYYLNFEESPAQLVFSMHQVPQEKSVIVVDYKFLGGGQ